jgi:hypothetical protein
MKIYTIIAASLLALGTVYSAEIKDLVLPGESFGDGWELTQPNIIGSAAAPNYINRSLEGNSVVSIQIITFPSPEAAKEKLEKKVGSEGYKEHVTKVNSDPLSYEQDAMGLKRRYILIKNYWITVDQMGKRDDRAIFIEKYTEHVAKNG